MPQPPLGGGGAPPGIWGPPGPWPNPPIYLPLPPDTAPPTEPPAVPPDMASPGYWAYVVMGADYKYGWVQLSFNTAEDHVPQPPEQGMPGEWIAVNAGTFGASWAWIPSPEPPPEKKKAKHSS